MGGGPGQVSSFTGFQTVTYLQGSDDPDFGDQPDVTGVCLLLAVLCLGCPTTEELDINPPPDAGPFLSISAGFRRSCGLTTDGEAQCWSGTNGLMSDSPTETMTMVRSGYAASCGVLDDRTAVCWGTGAVELGEIPTDEFVALDVGFERVCALRQGGAVECWSDSLDLGRRVAQRRPTTPGTSSAGTSGPARCAPRPAAR